MPTAVSLPSCQMDAYKALYPELDFSRVGFYSGSAQRYQPCGS